MPDQKIDNLLNLAIDATAEERQKSGNLNVGYDPLGRIWDVIVKYTGLESELSGSGIQEFPIVKDTTPQTHAYITSRTSNYGGIPHMKKLISCEFNIDTACMELKYSDGSMISIDTIAVENEVVENIYEQSELDYLIYNAPAEYADLILNGDPVKYLKTVTRYNSLDD